MTQKQNKKQNKKKQKPYQAIYRISAVFYPMGPNGMANQRNDEVISF